MKVSVVIITKNEEQALPACLDSVKFADEIVVIDDQSTDGTVRLAEQAGAKVFRRQFDGFATQKNFGIDKAAGDWILLVDADERVTPALASEIAALAPAQAVAYDIPFRNYIGSKWMKHGVLGRDHHIRLFNRQFARYGQREVHEMLEIGGEVASLAGAITHLTYATTKKYLEKVKTYSRREAEEAIRLQKFEPYHGVVREFLFRYLKLGGLWDGWLGLVSAAYETYYRWLYQQYVKGRRS